MSALSLFVSEPMVILYSLDHVLTPILLLTREKSLYFLENGCAYVVLGYFHRTVCAAQCNQSTDVILKEADRSGIYAVLEY